jgi:hypothetical protein
MSVNDDFFAENFGVDVEEVQPADKVSYDPIPAKTEVLCILTECKSETSQTGNLGLSITLQVAEGPHTGRLIFDRFNLGHSTQTVRERAQRDLRAMLDALAPMRGGTIKCQAPEELLHIPVRVIVRIEKGQGQYEDRNRVGQWLPAEGPAAAPTPKRTQIPQKTVAAASAAVGGKAKLPWEK